MIVTYGLFTADEYELPVAYADSIRKLSEAVGISASTLWSSLSHGYVIKGKFKVERIIF